MSLDIDFLEKYKQVATATRAPPTSLKQCVRCDETLSVSQFSVDKKRKDGLAVICKHCNREAIEKSRVKKRVWHREDEHYKMPGGYGATFKRRLDALYQKSVDDSRVYHSLVEGYVGRGLSEYEGKWRVDALYELVSEASYAL